MSRAKPLLEPLGEVSPASGQRLARRPAERARVLRDEGLDRDAIGALPGGEGGVGARSVERTGGAALSDRDQPFGALCDAVERLLAGIGTRDAGDAQRDDGAGP